MDISTIPTSSANTPTLATQTAETAADALKVDANFDTFLSLLTAQLRNQDPLEPVDSTNFVAQLAQFSAVEQQVQTNTALGEILGALGGEDASSLALWLGAEVQTPGPVFFGGDTIDLTKSPTPDATQSTLVVRNLAGDVIAQQEVSGQDGKITWNGLTNAGGEAPEGSYTFIVENMKGTTKLPTQDAAGFSKVEEVRLDGEAPTLLLQGRTAIGLDEVLAVR